MYCNILKTIQELKYGRQVEEYTNTNIFNS